MATKTTETTVTALDPEELEAEILNHLYRANKSSLTPGEIRRGLSANGIDFDETEELCASLASMYREYLVDMLMEDDPSLNDIVVLFLLTQKGANAAADQIHTCYEGCDHSSSDFL